MLAGCAGSQLSGATPASLPRVAGAIALSAPARSWMSSGTRNGDLLYVSDTNGKVYVYSYPVGKLVGTLVGFKGPGGLCSDRAGNIYVVDTPAVAVLKYAHGGRNRSKCSTSTAITRKAVRSTPPPEIWPSRTTRATLSSDPEASRFSEKAGAWGRATRLPASTNTFSAASMRRATFTLMVPTPARRRRSSPNCQHGSASLIGITLKQNLGPYPGAVQWDGKYVALADATTNVLYRIKVTGSNGTVVGTSRFKGDHSNLLAQFWIAGNTIVVPIWNREADGQENRFLALSCRRGSRTEHPRSRPALRNSLVPRSASPRTSRRSAWTA